MYVSYIFHIYMPCIHIQGMKLSTKKDKASVERILKLAETLGIEKTVTDKHHLNLLSNNRYVRACSWM